jgi:RNA polymerase sigma-70 factor (ECF subfamily)
MDDKEILALSYKNPAKFAELFDRHYSRLFAIARRALNSKEEAEDAVQEAFLKIYKYGRKFSTQEGDFTYWSNAILRNLIIDQIRKNQRKALPLTEEMESLLVAEEGESAESANYFSSVINKIDKTAAEVLNLRFVLGQSFKEIGRMLGISSGAARVRVLRAKKQYIRIKNEIDTQNGE